MLRHQGEDSKAGNCSVQFLHDITDQRFAPAAKVELGMLTHDIPDDAGSRMDYVLPRRLGVRALPALILENSPKRAQGHERINLNKISCKGAHRDRSGEEADESSVMSEEGESWTGCREVQTNAANTITRRGPRGQPPNSQAAWMRQG